MTNGHAYSRAARAFFNKLNAYQALSRFIIQIIELTEEGKDLVEEVLSDVQQCTVLEAVTFVEFKSITAQFETALHNLQRRGPTAKLWVQHSKMDAKGSYTVAGESVDPLNEAHSHRQEAATYYAMRMECLRKAQEAYRSGNKPVASYYSQLAQLHKQKVEQCNSAAASCLLSTHKAGNTLDLHFLHIIEAEVVLDMFLDEIINYISDKRKRFQTVFLITGRGLRSVGGVSRIKPMAIRKLQSRKVLYNEVNPGMLSALIRIDTPLSYT